MHSTHTAAARRARRFAPLLACALTSGVGVAGAFGEGSAKGQAGDTATKATVLLPRKELDLAKKVDVLTDEVQRLKEKLVIPEKESYKSVYGLGPAASKVYLLQQGLSVGGYGELFVNRIMKDKNKGTDYNT